MTAMLALVLVLSILLTACGAEPTQPVVAPVEEATQAPVVAQPAATEASGEEPEATEPPAAEQPAASEFRPVWYAPAPHPI
jgi:hypothetical protein